VIKRMKRYDEIEKQLMHQMNPRRREGGI